MLADAQSSRMVGASLFDRCDISKALNDRETRLSQGELLHEPSHWSEGKETRQNAEAAVR